MIKKLPFLIILVTITAVTAKSQFYVGAGPTFILPQNKLNELNSEAVGLNVIFETREFCMLWYGLRFDYFELEPIENIDEDVTYFEDALLISPQVRFNIFFDNCYEERVIPYLQGMLTISSINGTDELSRFGFGAAAGGGISMGFNLLSRCWLLDLTALWSAPNSIYRADKRHSIQSLNLGLTLSIGI